MGAVGVCAQASVAARVFGSGKKQAPLPSERTTERGEGLLEERSWAMAPKMAAPTADHQGMIIVVSDTEEEEQVGEGCFRLNLECVNVAVVGQHEEKMQSVPRLPSTSWSAGGLERNTGIEDELLDYDDGNESEAIDVQQNGRENGLGVHKKSNSGRSFGVLQETAKTTVRNDHHGGGSRMTILAGNLPQGEERREILVRVGGVSQAEKVVFTEKALVKDMGVQGGLADKDDSVNKDPTLENRVRHELNTTKSRPAESRVVTDANWTVRAGGGATPMLRPSWTRTQPRRQSWRRRRSAVSPGAGDYRGPGLPLQPTSPTIDLAPGRSTRTAQAAAAPLETSVTGAEP
ncbi:hypothetical protein NDU88_000679 [Pleurodeles waltl]|uniref:Uncharacterized protein n=1 Tax=Pleurodeles waltl TaxID=8319 RepID=A0AAV7UU28_PLEWA|nr:hypothetical protein NDU88_000679 [Pleurodeles waltl]